MGKTKKTKDVTVEKDAVATPPEGGAGMPANDAAQPAEESTAGSIVVKFRDHTGETVSRTFSKEVHGEDFKKLADEFKATNAARIVA